MKRTGRGDGTRHRRLKEETEPAQQFEGACCAAARRAIGDEAYEPYEFDELGAPQFLGEYCWVVFASGFRYAVVRDKFPAIEQLFCSFDLKSLAEMEPVERERLPIRNKRKADGFLSGCRMIAEEGFRNFKHRLKEDGRGVLESLPGIGPVTKDHLAKNIGLVDTAKPDIWLERCADECGAGSVDELVSYLRDAHPSFKVHQIDTILWDYCQRFQAVPPTGDAATTGVGVYAIEGVWTTPEVMAAGATIDAWARSRAASLTLRSAATRDEFLHHLRLWTAADASYGILYLRFCRSESDGVVLNDSGEGGASVSLEDIASAIEQGVYGSENCVVHLGPCWPRSATTEDIERFLERTGFAAISGYAEDVGWADALAFDLLYLERLSEAAYGGLLTPEVVFGCRDLLAGDTYGALSRSLGFRMVAAAA